MKFQRERDPESLLIEERTAELAAAGYPLPTHDTAITEIGSLFVYPIRRFRIP